MTEHPSNPNRRFTIFELVAYVSAFAVLFGLWRVVNNYVAVVDVPEVIHILFPLGFLYLFGALVGLGVAVLTGGRQRAVRGAVLGGGITIVLLGIFLTVMYVGLSWLQ